MPLVEYEGRTYRLHTIRFKCLRCYTLCETSRTYPDMTSCQCGAVRVDGGISAGANVYGNPLDFEDVSIYRTDTFPNQDLPQEVIKTRHETLRENYRKHCGS